MNDTQKYNKNTNKKYHYYLWVYWKSAFRGDALTDSEVTVTLNTFMDPTASQQLGVGCNLGSTDILGVFYQIL